MTTATMKTGTRETAARRGLWSLVRAEEWLACAVLLSFLVLDAAGVVNFRIDTGFIQAGSDTAGVFLVLASGIAGWRVMRSAYGRPDALPWWCVGLLVFLPLALVGVMAVHVLPFEWDEVTVAVSWSLLAALLAAFALRTLRAPNAAGRALTLRTFATQVALAMLEFVRTWAPFIVLLAAYENALWLVLEINPRLYDAQVGRLDEILFGGHPDLWFQQIASPGLTEVMAFFYNTLYVYPIVVGMALMFQQRTRELRYFLMAFVLAGYVGYVGYMFVPVIGPTYYFPKIYDVDLVTGEAADTLSAPVSGVGAGTEASSANSSLSFYELSRRLADKSTYGGNTPRNCFPSLHVGWAAVVMIFSWRYLRKLFVILFVPLTFLILATSYLRYHYGTDIIAGILLAVLVSDLGPRIIRFWDRITGRVPPPVATSGATPGAPAAAATTPAPARRRWPRWLGPALKLGLPVGFFLFCLAAVYGFDPLDHAAAAALERRYIRADAPTLPVESRVGLTFGAGLELIGVVSDKAEWHPGDTVTLSAWWRCAKPEAATPWKMLVHVRSPEGVVVVNSDHHPIFDSYPVARWKAGDIIEDVTVVRIPAARVAGEVLQVWLGFFDERHDQTRLAPGQSRYPHAIKDNAVLVLERALR